MKISNNNKSKMRGFIGRISIAQLITIISICVIFPCSRPTQALALTTMPVATGLSRPVFAASPPGDTTRLFIVEQYTAKIKILRDGQILPTPFLHIDSLVINTGNERGLLGMAFHPNYFSNGYFYLNYIDNSGNTVIARFQVSGNPDIANPNSRQTLLNITQPYSNHNGGMLAFGPNDGYLYIGMGDGGSGGDPQNRAQNDSTLLGKMLRIDVDGGVPYAIPPDNPNVGGPGLDEIWAKGLRNPWRWCFDPLNGDMYIADVGQDAWEEIDFQPGSSNGGENYGWRIMEGLHCYNPPFGCDTTGLIFPIHEFSHGGSPFRCSITGGFIYRGNLMPSLRGTYFFADYCSNQIWSFRYDGNSIIDFLDRTAELDPPGAQSIGDISSFGIDGKGDIYILDLADGEVFKIVPTISIDMIPDSYPISVPAGGSFSYSGILINNTSQNLITDVWIMVNVPGYGVFGPLGQFNNIALAPNDTIFQSGFIQNVPSYAPMGMYSYIAYCGDYQLDTISAASFPFEVTVISDVDADNWDLTGGFENSDFPVDIELLGNYPNPFNAQTNINFIIPRSGHVSLKIYNVLGQRVANMIDEYLTAGHRTIKWNAAHFASGIYFYRLAAGDKVFTKRMTLLK